MSLQYPGHVIGALNDGEHILMVLPEPERAARRRMLRAYLPILAVLASAIWLASPERPRGGGGDGLVIWATVATAILCFVHWIRACRTSYAVTSQRMIRFVSERMVAEVRLAECDKPFMLDFRKSPSVILRGGAKFMSLRPMVRIARKVPLPLTVASFVTGNDREGLRIGGPGRDLPATQVLETITRAWEAAQ